LAGELGIDTDNELLDTLVKRELDHRKKLSATIGQKIKYREMAQGAKPPQEVKPKPDAPLSADELTAKIREEFEQRDLDELEYPDDIKAVAKLKNVSVRQAAQDPYISYKIDAYNAEQKTEDAVIVRKDKGGKISVDKSKPPKVDMSTEEGRKAWDDYTRSLRQV